MWIWAQVPAKHQLSGSLLQINSTWASLSDSDIQACPPRLQALLRIEPCPNGFMISTRSSTNSSAIPLRFQSLALVMIGAVLFDLPGRQMQNCGQPVLQLTRPA